MPRVAITYEQVASIANGLYAAGNLDPGPKAVRDELAKRAGPGSPVGSPNTIQRHLNAWRTKDRPADAPLPRPELPAPIATAFNLWVDSAVTVERDKLQTQLDQVRAELEERTADGEALEAQVEQLSEQLAARTSERDAINGQLEARMAEIAELKAQLGSPQKTENKAR